MLELLELVVHEDEACIVMRLVLWLPDDEGKLDRGGDAEEPGLLVLLLQLDLGLGAVRIVVVLLGALLLFARALGDGELEGIRDLVTLR